MNNPTEIFVCGIDASGNKRYVLVDTTGALITSGGGGGGGGSGITEAQVQAAIENAINDGIPVEGVEPDIIYNFTTSNNESIIDGIKDCSNFDRAILYVDSLPVNQYVAVKVNDTITRLNSRNVDYFETSPKVFDIINGFNFNPSVVGIYDCDLYGDSIDVVTGAADGISFTGKLVLTNRKKGAHIDVVESKEFLRLITGWWDSVMPSGRGARSGASSFPVVLNLDNPIGSPTDPIASSVAASNSLISLNKLLANTLSFLQANQLGVSTDNYPTTDTQITTLLAGLRRIAAKIAPASVSSLTSNTRTVTDSVATILGNSSNKKIIVTNVGTNEIFFDYQNTVTSSIYAFSLQPKETFIDDRIISTNTLYGICATGLSSTCTVREWI